MMMMPNTVSFTSTLLAVFVTGAALLGGGSQYQVSAQLDAAPTQTASYPLSTTSATHCDTIVDNSVFSGTCCALNVTTGNGCVLNVAGGNCVVRTYKGDRQMTCRFSRLSGSKRTHVMSSF
jgi:hypothetical protein